MKKIIRYIRLKNEHGVSLVLVALLLIPLASLGALVVDLGLLYAARNELQNAADAGALAGARALYNNEGTEVNVDANRIACEAARENNALAMAGAIPVDVNWGDGNCNGNGNEGDVQRGHWSFATRTFTPVGDVLEPPDLWNVSDEELDDVNQVRWVNAVRVEARRQTTPVSSIFARIFGRDNFELSAEAVAYIGFAGSLMPGEVDLPIAICSQSLTGNTSFDDCESGIDCNIGFMLSDGQDKNTAGWTNFSQPCSTANTGSIRDLLTCEESNPYEIILGSNMGTTNGVVDAVINHPTHESLSNCWKTALYDSNDDGIKDAPIDADGDGWPDLTWNVTLPTINCPNLKVGNCMKSCGAVNANIIWILEKENKIDDDAPFKMEDWNMEGEPDGKTRWNSFATHFNLKTPNGNLATVENDGFKKKSIYFLPDCSPHELTGTTGGHNYGILAKVPVLVN